MMMNKIDNSGMGIAALGRDEDNYLAHVARGEMVVPPIISDDTRQRLYKEMMAVGLDPNEYTVGAGMSINPITGQPEFGWLKKVAKKVKKVIKPIAQVAQFVPGPWQAPAALISKASTVYDVAKGRANPLALLTVAGPLRVGPGVGESLEAIKAGGGLGATLKSIPGALQKGIGSFVKDPLGTIGGLFKGPETLEPMTVETATGTELVGYKNAAGTVFSPEEGMRLMSQSSGGLSRLGSGLQRIGQGIGSLVGPQTPYEEATGYGQSQLGRIEDFAKMLTGDTGQTRTQELLAAGYSQAQIDEAKANGTFNQLVAQARASGQTTGRGLIGGVQNIFAGGADQQTGGLQSLIGGLGSPAGLAGMYGLATYLAAKQREGGLTPTPSVTMDPLGRYQLAQSLGTGGTREEFGLLPAPQALQFAKGGEVRKHFNQGGLAMVEELDMRDGGESSGPGTGTSDDIPAMLSDGEFVMTAKATRGAGAYETKKTPKGIELIKTSDPSREAGVKNMRELMTMFEAV